MKPQLNLLFVHSDSMGYGRLGVNLARGIEQQGIEVYDGLPSPVQADKRAQAAAGIGREKICNVALWVSTPSHMRGFWEGQHVSIYSMWEATRIPESFRANLHEFERVIVPSLHNVELFSQYHDDVHFVPLGVDPERWHYVKRKPPGVFFNFLIGGSGARKGTDLAYQAFRTLWPKEDSWGSGPIPRLIMKSPRGEEVMGPRIEIIGGRIPGHEEVALYEDAHCYLQPSRGEGFGLQPLQAIAQGCPTILTDAHGHGSFAHLGWGLGSKMVKSAYFIYGDAGDWWEPSLDDLIDHMRWVYNNYDAACEKASMSATVVAKEFTWERTTNRVLDLLGRDRLEVPYSGPGTWHGAEEKRYRVITRRDWVADSVGKIYQFKKGAEYWESAELKRQLFEAQILDPACIDDGDGLTERQLEQLGEYSAAQGFCESCKQMLNSSPTRADLIFEEEERQRAGRL